MIKVRFRRPTFYQGEPGFARSLYQTAMPLEIPTRRKQHRDDEEFYESNSALMLTQHYAASYVRSASILDSDLCTTVRPTDNSN